MPCTRCTGMRVLELITEGGARTWALRCVICGDITDHVITKNREQPRYRPEGRPRTPVYVNRKWYRSALRPLSSKNQ